MDTVDIKFAVEYEHDWNILRSLRNEQPEQPSASGNGLEHVLAENGLKDTVWDSEVEYFDGYLSFMLALLTLEPEDSATDQNCDEETKRLRANLTALKVEIDTLDRSDENYYLKKEDLIFRVFCEYKGIPYHRVSLEELQGLDNNDSD